MFNNDIYLCYRRMIWYYVYFPIGVLVCATAAGIHLTEKRKLVLGVSACALILYILIALILPLPVKFFCNDSHEEFSRFPVFKYGKYCILYTCEDKLWKVSASTNSALNVGKKFHGEYYCSPLFIVLRQLKLKTVFILWMRLLRLQNEEYDICKFFPHIYTIDHERKAILVERIEHELTKERCPVDYKKQLSELDGHLRRLGLFLDDLHIHNVMVDNSGHIKIVDGEIYTLDEMQYLQSFTSVGSSSTPYENTTNIFTSMWFRTDRINANKVCL